MLYDNYLSLLGEIETSSQLKQSEAKLQPKTRKQGQLLCESGYVLRIAPTSFSRDRRIKMKKSIRNQSCVDVIIDILQSVVLFTITETFTVES